MATLNMPIPMMPPANRPFNAKRQRPNGHKEEIKRMAVRKLHAGIATEPQQHADGKERCPQTDRSKAENYHADVYQRENADMTREQGMHLEKSVQPGGMTVGRLDNGIGIMLGRLKHGGHGTPGSCNHVRGKKANQMEH